MDNNKELCGRVLLRSCVPALPIRPERHTQETLQEPARPYAAVLQLSPGHLQVMLGMLEAFYSTFRPSVCFCWLSYDLRTAVSRKRTIEGLDDCNSSVGSADKVRVMPMLRSSNQRMARGVRKEVIQRDRRRIARSCGILAVEGGNTAPGALCLYASEPQLQFPSIC